MAGLSPGYRTAAAGSPYPTESAQPYRPSLRDIAAQGLLATGMPDTSVRGMLGSIGLGQNPTVYGGAGLADYTPLAIPFAVNEHARGDKLAAIGAIPGAGPAKGLVRGAASSAADAAANGARWADAIFARKSAGLYNPPSVQPRPFAADYPAGAQTDEAGRLGFDIEGRPLTAQFVAGRRESGGVDSPIRPEDLAEVSEGLFGTRPVAATSRELGRDAGRYVVARGPDGPERTVLYDRSLPEGQASSVVSHELGHGIDEIAGTIPPKGLNTELRQLYNTLNTGQQRTRNLTGPQHLGYRGDDVGREMMAEAVRAYITDPNYIKTAAPKTAAAIRAAVNANPRLSRTIQFNTLLGGLVGTGAAAGLLADPSQAQAKPMGILGYSTGGGF